jgi:hypothetical protein
MIDADEARKIYFNIPCDISDILEKISTCIIETAKSGERSLYYLLGKSLTNREYEHLKEILIRNGYVVDSPINSENSLISITW